MIGLFLDDTTRLPITYNGWTGNDPTDPPDDTYEINTIVLIFQVDTIQDARQDEDGTEAYGVSKNALLLRVDGTIRAPTIAKFFDKIRDLSKYFDPAKVSHENPTTLGFLPLDFTTPSASGNLACRYYMRARRIQVPPISQYTGRGGFFTLELLAVDPRRYKQTPSTKTGAGTAANSGDYRTFPTLTITMAGAGSAAYAITNTPPILSATTLTLDLSGMAGADVVVVDMFNRTIQKNGADAPTLYVSGDYFPVEPGNNTISYANTTNATSVLSWRDAFCL